MCSTHEFPDSSLKHFFSLQKKKKKKGSKCAYLLNIFYSLDTFVLSPNFCFTGLTKENIESA